MPAIIIHGLDGTTHNLTGEDGQALMVPLRDAGLVEGICGGAASCGTCHIFLREEWVAPCGERSEEEGYMFEALEEEIEVRGSSRLACQIELSAALDGLTADIAPQL